MVNYAETIIYKIVCKDLTIKNVYVGHTTNFRRRKCNHKKCCNNKNYKYHNLNVYKFIRENGGWNNFEMIMIEEYNCENKLQAHQRERYWIETLNADLNCIIPTRTQKEYNDINKEQIIEYQKKWYEENKNKILEKIICECGCEVVKGQLFRHQRTKKHLKLIEDKTE